MEPSIPIPREIETIDLPIVELGQYQADPTSEAALAECTKAWQSMTNFGISVIRDPRADLTTRIPFLRHMRALWEGGPELQDACRRDGTGMALGWWGPGSETARHWPEVVEALEPQHLPFTAAFERPPSDPKGRWHHRVWLPEWEQGLREEQLAALRQEQVVPPGEQFADWVPVLDTWGRVLLRANITHAEMVALGGGIERDYFTAGMVGGTSLLAPTIVDLAELTDWEIVAGFHYDFDRFACHGPTDFKGLIVWLRDGRRVLIRVPGGCLVVQAGAEAEYMTGGQIHKGFHEVVAFPDEIQRARALRRMGQGASTLRIGSHCFSQGRDDIMQPHPRWRTPETLAKYPPVLARDRQAYEIALITGAA